MTHALRNTVLTAALAAATFFPTANAFGRTSVSAAPTGAVVAIDRENHALLVLDRATRKTFRVQIPKDSQIAISALQSKGSTVNFEQVLVGMQYRGIR